jgi:hypothetical protein
VTAAIDVTLGQVASAMVLVAVAVAVSVWQAPIWNVTSGSQ